MGASTPQNRGPIWAELTRVQNAQAIDNLSRAFHLPRPKAKAAILDMLAALTLKFDEQTLSRGALARLIELLGKNDYERVLEDPTLMGATSTQVIGNEALTAIAGHSESIRIAARAAAAAGISEMIAEYLLPVVAAMFFGALSVRTRGPLLALARDDGEATDDDADDAVTPSLTLPVGRGSSGLFSGAMVLTPGSGPDRETIYRELAERVRTSGAGENDPIGEARRIMAEGLGVRARQAPWLANVQKWAVTTLQDADAHIRERLRKLRSRNSSDNDPT